MEGETKITTVKKVKEPRKVELGKKLAAISREAKARRSKLQVTLNSVQNSLTSCL